MNLFRNLLLASPLLLAGCIGEDQLVGTWIGKCSFNDYVSHQTTVVISDEKGAHDSSFPGDRIKFIDKMHQEENCGDEGEVTRTREFNFSTGELLGTYYYAGNEHSAFDIPIYIINLTTDEGEHIPGNPDVIGYDTEDPDVLYFGHGTEIPTHTAYVLLHHRYERI